ncbi:Liprin-beta-1 [Tupaia chinensis]|uniref:Liprin-beta-1 n=1 Tax=Tupaia chinensis TaxID=246437 RepID=L9LBU8_TUPCH|nr:Liprin-beta-1 [Tupaia chinensis]
MVMQGHENVCVQAGMMFVVRGCRVGSAAGSSVFGLDSVSWNLVLINKKMMSDASDMLAAALEQMDGIIAGSKALEYSNGIFDCQSPTSPFMGSLRALHLVEDLRGLLEMMDTDEKEGLRCQIPDSTAETLIEWLQSQMVSVLTDQVDAQGEKIRDLEFCLEEHREKLNATEEMLQQELLSRTSLETQKLDLMAEISNLKLKLTAVEKDRLDYEDRFRDTEGLMQEINDLRLKISEMESERLQYEKKLKSTKDELASLKEQLEEKEAEVKRLQEKLVGKMKGEGIEILDRDIEVQKMKKAVESLMAANEEKLVLFVLIQGDGPPESRDTFALEGGVFVSQQLSEYLAGNNKEARFMSSEPLSPFVPS